MQALGLSPLEMRQIIESQFLPLRCECLEEPGNTLTIRIHDPHTNEIALSRTGISHESFNSSRAILHLVGELRSELAQQQTPHAKAG